MSAAMPRNAPTLPRIATLLMLLAYAAACVLHADRVPLWCLAAAGCNLLWYWLHRSGRRALPSRWARYTLTLAMLGGVAFSFGTLNGLAAGTALLMCMGGAKLLEVRTARDAVVVTTVALILVLAAGLDRQDLWRLPLYLLTGWLALSTIAALGSHAASFSVRLAFREAGVTMALAIPFAVMAFVLVPRLPGALWSMPGGERAQTGLSEEMNPGSISDLATSDAIAFRVRFEAALPQSADRYWRGPVLHDFDGSTWRNERGVGGVRQESQLLSDPVRYQVMLEPHQQAWLFTLERGASLDGRRHLLTFDHQFRATRPVSSPLIYQAVSHLRVRDTGSLALTTRRRDTRLPPARNPRSIELAHSLRAAARDDADYARRVMAYFGSNGFEYTLTPPLLNYNSVDDLLFNTRLGFCGHFASAYVTLMRAGGVPARVVTGYLGGSWNPVGEYLLVRQSDAHAWAEVWLDGSGWTRFDPTTMVAPERLSRGLNDLLPETRSAASALVEQSSWLRAIRDAWDASGSWWRERVVNFNAESQQSLLRWLGLGNIDYRGMALALLIATAAWGAALLFAMRVRRPRERRDRLGRLWDRYLALLARRGLPVSPHDGPEALRRQAQRQWPMAAQSIEHFTQGYVVLRFGRNEAPPSTAALNSMREHLRAIARATAAHRRPGTAAAAPV